MAENVTAKVNGQKTDVCRLKISTTPERGLEIFLQSNHNFSMFGDAKQGTFKIGGVECVIPRNGNGSQLPGVPGYFYTEKERYQVENYLNLSMLLAKDLKSGVVFSFGVFPISDDKIRELGDNWRTQAKLIYLTYLRPFSVSVVVSTETVERVPED